MKEENSILKRKLRKKGQAYYINNSIITTSEERDLKSWVWALPLATAKLGGGALVSYHHHNSYLYRFS